MKLTEIIAELGTSDAKGGLDQEISGIAYDSRRVTPGMLFVAIPGSTVDGHEFIGTAINRGATAILCQDDQIKSHRAAVIRVPDARAALAKSAAAFYQHPSAKLTVIGITGTNGKTTVSFMIKQILEYAGSKAGLIGTVRYEIGDRMIPAQRTTPEALEIQQMMQQMLRADCNFCVMEVSSHALEQNRVDGVEFDVAVFTNLTPDHLDYHGTMEAYFDSKKKLFHAARACGKSETAIVGIDCPFGARLANEETHDEQWTTGQSLNANIRAREISVTVEGTGFVIVTPEGEKTCWLPLIGRHNVSNALSAIATALSLEIPLETIVGALAGMKPVPGRLEALEQGQAFSVFVDYAHTEDALRHALMTLREVTKGRLLIAFGCGGNRDHGKRHEMGKTAAELADVTIITSDNPRQESPEAIADQIAAGYASVRNDGWSLELDRRRAIDSLIRLAEPGDVVLIAGKGHETYQEFESTVVPFDDRIHARETLDALGFEQLVS